MTVKRSQEPSSRFFSSRPAGEKKRRSPGARADGARLRGDVPDLEAAEQWRQTFDAVPDLIAILDTQHRIVRINQAMADRLGLPKGQCVGQTYYRLVHGTDEPPPFCPHSRVLQDGEEHTVEVHEERLAGDFFVTVSPLRDSAGRLVGSVHVARDITERKRAEEALRESREAYRATFETTGTAMLIGEEDSTISMINAEFEKLCGYSKAEVEGKKSWQEFVTKADLERLKKSHHLRMTDPSAAPPYYEFRFIDRQGKVRDVSITLALIPGTSRTVGSLLDITERKRAEEELREREMRFRDLAELLPQTVYEMDVEGRLAFVNRQALHTFGYTQADFEAGVSCFDMLAAEELDRARQNVQRVLQGQDWGGTEYTAQRKDGTQFPIVIYSSPVLRGDTPVGLRGIIIDITERKRAERELRESEARFAELFANMSSGVAVFEAVDGGADFVFKDFNKAGERIECTTREEVIGRRVTEAFPGVKEFGLLDVLQQVWRTGTPQHHPVSAYKDERTAGWRENYVYRLPSGEVVAVYDDVTEHKQAEEALRASETRYRTLIETAQEGIGIVDPDENIVFVNQAYVDMLGYKKKELLGLNLRELTDERGFSKYVNETRKRRAGHSSRYETVLRHKTGKPKYISVSASPLYDDSGTFAGTLGLLTDTTERRRAEAAFRRSEKMQAEAEKLAATGRMAARVAHEINNPLAGIKNSFRLIRNAVPEDHPDHDMVGRIEREIDRIAHIVRQMYKLHSPRAQTPTDVPVEETIRDVLLMLEPLRREHEVTIELAPVSPKLIVRAPEGSLQQVLYNLTANAIQVSPRRAIVNIDAEPADKDYVRISIRDQGPGIPAEVRDRVFEPFFSADTGSGTREGIGLGLSVVRSIVESLEGKIEFESRVAEGTCFHVYLPSKQP